MPDVITIHAGDVIGVIRPALHGHFLEHLGTATYGGIWVGRDSTIPNIDGLRRSAVEYLRDLAVPVLRWPGGCFADGYHWRDGIGPADRRPRTVNHRWGGVVEDNGFGTHEFMRLCDLIGAAPYFAANMGSGSPAEVRDWVEYCNYPSGSSLADRRVANGAGAPFGVRTWGLGNESWACGGTMTAEEYAALYARFATFVPTCGVTTISGGSVSGVGVHVGANARVGTGVGVAGRIRSLTLQPRVSASINSAASRPARRMFLRFAVRSAGVNSSGAFAAGVDTGASFTASWVLGYHRRKYSMAAGYARSNHRYRWNTHAPGRFHVGVGGAQGRARSEQELHPWAPGYLVPAPCCVYHITSVCMASVLRCFVHAVFCSRSGLPNTHLLDALVH